MTTSSTKSGKKNRTKRHPVQSQIPRSAEEVAVENDIPDRVWTFGVIGIFLIGTILRLYNLNLVPLHHDEGVNGNFLMKLVREGAYRYDPENYHGPTLYYFSAIIPWTTKLLFGAETSETYGLTTFNIRLITALFGIATIALIFLLRKQLGTLASLAAGLMLAISPGAVYLSRYFIHETLFTFFTLGIVVALVWFYEKRRPSFLILAAVSVALLFATKETSIISAGVLIIALASTFIYVWLYRGAIPSATATLGPRQSSRALAMALKEMGGTPNVVAAAIFAFFMFLGVYALFYSSFFQNPYGIYDSFKTFDIWAKTGSAAHVHPASQYIKWMVKQEAPLLFFGAVGAAIVVLKPKNSLALFCALWSFGLIAAYSLIPYKTPWLMLNFVVPLALITGYAIQAIYEMDRRQLRGVSITLLLATSISLYQCIDLNFRNYDNDAPRYVYVYAHTKRNLLDLVREVDRIAKEEQGGTTGISIISPDYWPLPWYFRNYSRVGYFGRMAASSEPIIIANANQKDEVDSRFGEFYEQVRSNEQDGTFELRPGVSLLLYRRRG